MISLVIGFFGGYDTATGWKRRLDFSPVFVFGRAVGFTATGVIAPAGVFNLWRAARVAGSPSAERTP